ncbi:MAG TPA: DUF4019 domain-containing protein [Rhizomicrobium sp.]|jgi:hypothetical protein
MLARIVLAALLSFAVAAPAFSQPRRSAQSSAATPTPDDRARQWLVLLDDKNYAQSYSQSGAAFRSRQNGDVWSKSASSQRTPLGAVASRDLKSIDVSRDNIAVIRYDTVFAHKAATVETVTLAFENGGWSVADYSVN